MGLLSLRLQSLLLNLIHGVPAIFISLICFAIVLNVVQVYLHNCILQAQF